MRRPAAVLLAASLALAGLAVSPVTARADDTKTLTVVGTSDVFDSDLVQAVIKPGFEKAYPQYTLNYVSKGTGAAIAYAEAGTASALVVHAATVENQFVDQGYSLEKYGRAIFYGDYVVAGPKADPAAVGTADPHDVVSAYEAIAKAGAAGTANFVSRGGTPGTTIQEHQLWALTTGVTTCTVSAANGGGASPSTQTGACPSSIPYPSWYHATGLTQGPNITNADTCNYTGGNCYVFTDRGTYSYLVSQGSIANLTLLARQNATSARGGTDALTNLFHAYAINPAKFSGDTAAGINTAAATAFLDYVTSADGQAAVGAYLNGSNDAPFVPDAQPTFTASALPPKILAGRAFNLTGQLTNVAPGTAALAGQTVTLSAREPGQALLPVATATTTSTGSYALTFRPTSSADYVVSTGELAQVERPDLSPVFGDLLNATTVPLGHVAVLGAPAAPRLTQHGTAVTVNDLVLPTPHRQDARVRVFAAETGQPYRQVAIQDVKPGAGAFAVGLTLTPKKRWNVYTTYQSLNGQFSYGTSPVSSISVH